MADKPARNPGPGRLRDRLLRGLLGLILLLGPLVAVELTMRSKVAWLRPVLRAYTVAMDLKLLMLEQRDACPDAITFGTSLTDHSLPPRYLAKQKLDGVAITDPFDFGLAESRATNMLAQYRWLRQRGCTPTWIFVEVSPIAINAEHGGRTHDRSLLSARAQLGMPEGFFELRGYTIAERLELATYDRLLIHRRRDKITDRALNQFAAEQWFMSKAERAKAKPYKQMNSKPKLEQDGKLTPIREGMTAQVWRGEQRKRRSAAKGGRYKWLANEPEQAALLTLAREAADDGVVVILHSPPVTALYHAEISPMLGITPDFEAFTPEVAALADELPNVVWHDAHTDLSYTAPNDFTDWVHLSKPGSKRYIKQLIAASNAALLAEQGG